MAAQIGYFFTNGSPFVPCILPDGREQARVDDALFLGLFLSLSHTGKYKAGLQGMMHMFA
ncbi:hypothetical protein B5F76_06415 [Desulfovibrio sp. An276]|nr:hypothetical protein B5F76_06415 [Desulfovibrio sp. An276]